MVGLWCGPSIVAPGISPPRHHRKIALPLFHHKPPMSSLIPNKLLHPFPSQPRAKFAHHNLGDLLVRPVHVRLPATDHPVYGFSGDWTPLGAEQGSKHSAGTGGKPELAWEKLPF